MNDLTNRIDPPKEENSDTEAERKAEADENNDIYRRLYSSNSKVYRTTTFLKGETK